MANEAQLKAMQEQIDLLMKNMEALKIENESLKNGEANVKSVAYKYDKVSDADLTRLKILSTLELKVGESLKLKSDTTADVLIYKRAVENYLKANAVLFVLDESQRDANNVYLCVENEISARVYQFIIDSWPESLRNRYASQAENNAKKLWSLLMKDSFKIEVSKITAAKENFKKVKYNLGMKPEDLVSKLEKAFNEYEHLIEIFNSDKKTDEKISFPDLERVAALYHALSDAANESPMFIVLRLALKDLDSWKKAKDNFVSLCDTVNETYATEKEIKPRYTNAIKGKVIQKNMNENSEQVCWNCGETGHKRMQCEKERSICGYCEKKGHLEEYCFYKKLNDKKKYQKKGGEAGEKEIDEHNPPRIIEHRAKGANDAKVAAMRMNLW